LKRLVAVGAAAVTIPLQVIQDTQEKPLLVLLV
jgi:hypothetical protein